MKKFYVTPQFEVKVLYLQSHLLEESEPEEPGGEDIPVNPGFTDDQASKFDEEEDFGW